MHLLAVVKKELACSPCSIAEIWDNLGEDMCLLCTYVLISEWTAAGDVLSSSTPLFFWGIGFLSGYLMVHWRRMCILGMTSTRWLTPSNSYTQVMHMQGRYKNDKLKKNQARRICDSDSFACPPLQCRGYADFQSSWGNFSQARRSEAASITSLQAACCACCAHVPFSIAFSREPYSFFREDEWQCPNSNS